MSFTVAQTQPFYLSGSGAIIGATSITLKSFRTIDGSQLYMTSLGDKGFMTLEPGNSTQEEQISFTTVTLNSNGTTTLGGVKNVSFLTPYTETSGLAKTHAGSSMAVLSNTSGFYGNIKNYVDTGLSAGAVPATTTVNGIGKVSVAPVDSANPIFVGDNDGRVPTQAENDAIAYAATSPIVRTYLNAASPATWTKPAGLKYVIVEVQANGGNGGSANYSYAGGGGGSGGYSKKNIVAASLGSTETVTIGNGANSSFGSHCTTGYGTNASGGSRGAGGTATGGDINIAGGNGTNGLDGSGSPSYTVQKSGKGGNSFLGIGGSGLYGASTGGDAGTGYGSGGAGGTGNTVNIATYGGGSGAPAIVIVTEYYI